MINYSIEYESEALAALDQFTQVVSDRIINKIHWLADNFEQITPEPLTSNLAGFYKLRVGDYRVIYDFIREEKIIIVDRIGHRRDVYD